LGHLWPRRPTPKKLLNKSSARAESVRSTSLWLASEREKLPRLRLRSATFEAKAATGGHDIGFGIGIAHGFATLGTIGFEGRFDYAAIGTV
jgi:hypothetical protein